MGRKRNASARAAPAKQEQKKSRRQREVMMDVTDRGSDLDEFVAEDEFGDQVEEEEELQQDQVGENLVRLPERRTAARASEDGECEFLGDPVPVAEAKRRWPERFEKAIGRADGGSKSTTSQGEPDETPPAKKHFTSGKVDGVIYNLGDDAYVKAEEGKDNYICKIIEMFEAVDGVCYFTAQWYYRAKETVITACDEFVDPRRVFFSEIKDDNELGCLVQKVSIHRIPYNGNSNSRDIIPPESDFYCNMMYFVPCSSFLDLLPDSTAADVSTSTISSESDVGEVKALDSEKTLLDIYSGCGGMSTGLCLGANSCNVNLVTKWAVDMNGPACESLRLNHPETNVMNMPADTLLALIKEWQQLCVSCMLITSNCPPHPNLELSSCEEEEGSNDDDDDDVDDDGGEAYEVEHILDICYRRPNGGTKSGLYFKIHWKGYSDDYDTWEPIDGLSGCPQKIKEFVVNGFKEKRLPLPGHVDVICGGPPCQGISGFNRFRNFKNPLEDPKNQQMKTFMDLVDFLRPKFVLMENVVDLFKFSSGFLGRYALSRLVGMNYQARVGMLAAGAYGLPQFRMRVFLWGALQGEKLPQFPLPTHKVDSRSVTPKEFERNSVEYENRDVNLKEALFLEDAISDLPKVENNEVREEMPYIDEPKTHFQRAIRLGRDGVLGQVLYDHCPLRLNDDDYQRVCRVPKRKGANFRDLPGVRVVGNKVELDPNVERVYLPSGKPLVPNYALSFVRGTSIKPFKRLWWDETVPTVVTRAEPHNQAICHPVQDRVLTVRENARLQGFPDYYKLCGSIKDKYTQVGNAVAVPVAKALGYSLALSFKGLSEAAAMFTLPHEYGEIDLLPADQTSSAEFAQ